MSGGSEAGAGLDIVTLGCRLNAYESEVIRSLARGAGLANAVIVNTCAVTAEAERQARQAIRRARRHHPSARIIVTGCAAQIHPQRYAAMAEVDQVLGNAEKLQLEAYGNAAAPLAVNDIQAVRETALHLIGGFEGRARAFVQVQQGCDHRCTFCIIPYGRGPSRSVPIGVIVAQLRALVASGVREIVLTGVDITDYGKDLPGRPTLGQMVRRVLAAVPELQRLRLSSLDPAEIDAELFHLVGEEPRLMPHIHLSLQAGDDLILKRMRRRHSRSQAVAVTAQLRALRPGIALGADLIAGFPTESQAMFENTLGLVEECGLAFLHVFPFSAREGTPAARMPQVPVAERRARAHRLREAGALALARFLQSRVGTDSEVLVEQGTRGRTEHFAPARLDRPQKPGGIVRAEIVGVGPGVLEARIAA